MSEKPFEKPTPRAFLFMAQRMHVDPRHCSAWLLTCTALVWIMIPGVGYLYSGLVRRKNALTVLFLTMLAMAIISFQWFIWGYSLAFSPTGGKFLGDMHYALLRHVLETPVPQANNKVPQVVYMM